jgi:acyl-CoA thioesterase-2
VDRLRDGRSFSARRVLAVQHGQPILSAIASFQVPEAGLEHSAQMPEVPAPEGLPSRAELRERSLATATEVPPRVVEALRKPSAFDFRPVDPVDPLQPAASSPAQSM